MQQDMGQANKRIIQSTAVAIAVPDHKKLCGVVIRGASGIGKSSLALNLIDSCPLQKTRLIGDDGIVVETIKDNSLFHDGGDVQYLSPHPNIMGQIECFGMGVLPIDYVENIPMMIEIELHLNAPRFIGQNPEALMENTVALPIYCQLNPNDVALCAKIRLLCHWLMKKA